MTYKRESIYQFYEDGIAKKPLGKSRGVFVAVKTLVGQGGGTIGVTDTGRKLTEYILDAIQEQYYAENGKPLSIYPVEILADRFETELDLYYKPLAKFLKDPKFFDEEEQEEVDRFLDDLRNSKNPTARRDCGQKLWRFYREYLKTTPDIPLEAEAVLKHTVETLLAQGYEGLLLTALRSSADVGFVVDKTDSTLSIDMEQKSWKQLVSDKITKRDLVLNFHKPKPGEWRLRVYQPGNFADAAREVIRDFLTAHPGATKDRIYDALVSVLFRKGKMEAHDFDALLRGMAEEVQQSVKKNLFEQVEPDLFGSHIQSRGGT